MKLEDMVCTFEQAKELHDLGITQKSWFSWRPAVYNHQTTWISVYHTDVTDKFYAAFSVAELGVMLNATKNYTRDAYFHNPSKMYSHSAAINPALFKTEAESRADMLIHLLKKNLLTTDQVNKALTA